jgi:hypothetical protein
MARSPEIPHLLLAAALACAACTPAHAAPATADEKAARKQKREQKKAEQKKADKKQPEDRPTKSARQPREPRPATTPTAALPPCPPDNTLTWRSFGGGFLLTWCTGCHSSTLAADARQGAPDDINFDSHAAFKPHDRLVYERAVLEAHAVATAANASASPMPPAGLPSDADRKRLAQWIACGAPLP